MQGFKPLEQLHEAMLSTSSPQPPPCACVCSSQKLKARPPERRSSSAWAEMLTTEKTNASLSTSKTWSTALWGGCGSRAHLGTDPSGGDTWHITRCPHARDHARSDDQVNKARNAVKSIGMAGYPNSRVDAHPAQPCLRREITHHHCSWRAWYSYVLFKPRPKKRISLAPQR